VRFDPTSKKMSLEAHGPDNRSGPMPKSLFAWFCAVLCALCSLRHALPRLYSCDSRNAVKMTAKRAEKVFSEASAISGASLVRTGVCQFDLETDKETC
jgi:hypothetical protein